MTTAQQLVVGIFQDQTQAELAVDELVRAGFEEYQIDFAEARPSASTDGILGQIKNLFTGQNASPDWLYQDLMRMGVHPEEIRSYQREFEAGHSIVAVHGTVGMQMAGLIMARNGGHGPNRSATQSASSDQGTGTPQSTSENVNSDQGTGAQQPTSENVNSDQGTGAQQSIQDDINEDTNMEPDRSSL